MPMDLYIANWGTDRALGIYRVEGGRVGRRLGFIHVQEGVYTTHDATLSWCGTHESLDAALNQLTELNGRSTQEVM